MPIVKNANFFTRQCIFFRIFQIFLKMRYFPKKIQFCTDFFDKLSVIKPNKYRNTHNLVWIETKGRYFIFFLNKRNFSFLVEREHFVLKCQFFHISYKNIYENLLQVLIIPNNEIKSMEQDCQMSQKEIGTVFLQYIMLVERNKVLFFMIFEHFEHSQLPEK